MLDASVNGKADNSSQLPLRCSSSNKYMWPRKNISSNYSMEYLSFFQIMSVLVLLLFAIYPSEGAADEFIKSLEEKSKYIPPHKNGSFSVSCSINGEYYGGANETERLIIRRVDDGRVVKDIRSGRDKILSFEFDPNGENIAIGYIGGVLGIQSLREDAKEKRVNIPVRPISDIEYSPDGKYIVVAGGAKILVLNAEDLSELYTVSDMSTQNAISISKDSSIVAVGNSRGVTLLNLKNGNKLQHLGDSDVFCLNFNSDSKFLAFAYMEYGVIWNSVDSKVEYSILDSVQRCIALNPDGNVLSIGGTDGVVKQIDLQKQEPMNHIVAPGGSVRSMKSCGERYIITGHSYDTMNVLDISAGRIVRTHYGNN